MKTLLAVDPGKTTGFAKFGSSEEGRWRKLRIGCRTDLEHIYDLILDDEPDTVVIENFRLYPWKSNAQAWSQLDTVRIIGAIVALCFSKNIPVVMQTTGNRDIGYKWGGVPVLPKSNPSNHAHDAWAHAAFYIVDNGWLIDD